MRRSLVYILLAVTLTLSVEPAAAASPAGPITTQYPVSGSPLRVAVEAPGRVWFTLPDDNSIGRLVVTSAGVGQVDRYLLPTPASRPYDIAYAAGAVWVTEEAGNKIARFDPLAAPVSAWREYPITTPGSQPRGLAVLEGPPLQVWFAERATNRLGQLTVGDNLTGVISEFPLPSGSEYANAQMEDVDAEPEYVWFTLPGAGYIGRFRKSSQAFAILNPRNYPWLYPGKTLRPWQVKLDEKNLPWFTEPGTNQLMRFNPNTTATFEHYPVVTQDAGLDGLDITHLDLVSDDIVVWFTGRTTSRVGRLHRTNYTAPVSELPLPASAPTDIAADADGCAWIAASGRHSIIRWCKPYFRQVYLPALLSR